MPTVQHQWRFTQPHAGQVRLRAALHQLEGRAGVLTGVTGRRWGKTTGILEATLEDMLRIQGFQVAWFSHQYPGVRVAWEETMRRVPRTACAYEPIKSTHDLGLVTGSRMQMFTAENPDQALGRGFDRVIVDEAARVGGPVIDEAIMPMLIDRGGHLIKITTPKGKTGKGAHVFRDYQRALQGAPGYHHFTGPTTENPLPTVAEWVEFCRTNLPRDAFEQEIMARFLDYGLGILDLRPVSTLAGDDRHPVRLPWKQRCSCPQVRPVGGLDLAKKEDYTVPTLLCRRCGQLLYLDRFRRMEWPVQVQRIRDLDRDLRAAWKPCYRPRWFVDATGLGDVVVDMLAAAGVRHEPVVFQSAVTATLVQGLQVATEQEEIELPWVEELIGEADMLEAEVLSSGRVRYGAADGFHDDTVFSLALAVYGRHAGGPEAAGAAAGSAGVSRQTYRKGGAFLN